MRIPNGRILSLKQELVLNEIIFSSKEVFTIQNGIRKEGRTVSVNKLAESLGMGRESVLRYKRIFEEKAKNIKKTEEEVKERKLNVEIEIQMLKAKLDCINNDLEYVEFLKDFSKIKFRGM